MPMFQAARQGGLTSLARCGIRVRDKFLLLDVARLWGDLPDSHRHSRIHMPLCCCYTKISIGTGPWSQTTHLPLIERALYPMS